LLVFESFRILGGDSRDDFAFRPILRMEVDRRRNKGCEQANRIKTFDRCDLAMKTIFSIVDGSEFAE
jgi:hypothetical protein